MTKKIKIIQISLIFFGIALLLSVYWLYPQINKNKNKVEILKNEEEIKKVEKNIDSFEKVEYRGLYQDINPFILKAEKAYIKSNTDPNTIYMTSMKIVLSLKNGETWNIICNKGRYIKLDYDIYCEENVLASNGKTKITSGFLNILSTKDTAQIYENVIIKDIKGSVLQADSVDYDLQEKKYKVSMYSNNEKIKIKIIE